MMRTMEMLALRIHQSLMQMQKYSDRLPDTIFSEKLYSCL